MKINFIFFDKNLPINSQRKFFYDTKQTLQNHKMTNALHKSLFRDIHSNRIISDDKKNK